MVAGAEADGLEFRAALENLRAASFQVIDEDDAVAIRKQIAVGVLHGARAGGRGGFAGAFPFVTAGDTFPFSGNSKTSVISPIGQAAGLLMKEQPSRISSHNSTAHLARSDQI